MSSSWLEHLAGSQEVIGSNPSLSLSTIPKKASSQTQSYARNLRTLVLAYKGEGLGWGLHQWMEYAIVILCLLCKKKQIYF